MGKLRHIGIQFFADTITKLADMVDPEVMADMISAKIPKKIRVAPFAKVDTTLQGVPGSTITVPSYGYIGDAADVAEGAEVTIEKMATTTKTATIKKAMKGVGLTDEAVLSGYGNPVGEATGQLALSIAAKLDNDSMDTLQTATVTVYHQEGYARTVVDRAFLDFRKTRNVEKTGSSEVNSFLLVIPCAVQGVFVGDKVLLGEGPEVATREAWAALIPAKVPGLVVVRYVDPKYWNGKLVHVEAGG